MCIYYKEREGLSYAKREHVFPAGIGGILTLPQGVVSDQFNYDISKIERSFLRDGIISIPRQFWGPGKRGNLNPKRATKSKIQLITDVSNPNIFALGYTQLGRNFEIPHLDIDITTGECKFSFSRSEMSPEGVITEFTNTCLSKHAPQFKITYSDILPLNRILIGITKDMGQSDEIIIYQNSKTEFEVSNDRLKDIISRLAFNAPPIETTYMPRVEGKLTFHLDHLRIYGKIAINYLAFKMGKEIVLDPAFDACRNWIAYGGHYDDVKLNYDSDNTFRIDAEILPADSHHVYVTSIENVVLAEVCLYGSNRVSLLLARDLRAKVNLCGMVCDWKKRVELDIFQAIAETVEKSDKKIKKQ